MEELNPRILETIPIDSGGLIRVGILDLTRGYGPRDIINFLDNMEDEKPEDVKALRKVAEDWYSEGPLDVMESGTLFRQVWFYLTKNKIDRQILTRGTLTKRVAQMDLNPDLVNWTLQRLGTLEGSTSQWQTAAILMGNTEKLEEVPFYLRKTYDRLANWEKQRTEGKIWDVPRDPTLITQSEDYILYLKTGKIRTEPDRLGDCDLYPFLRAFGAVERTWAEKNWPQLAGHESNRFEHTDEVLRDLDLGKVIESADHRVVEFGAMKIQAKNIRENYPPISVEQIKQRFTNPNCVSKKWPKFWDFMDYCKSFQESH